MPPRATIPTVEPGDRVRIVHWHVSHPGPPDHLGLIRDTAGDVVTVDDNTTIPPGTTGTVWSVADHQIGVTWDNGGGLFILPGEDEFEVLDK